MSESEIHNQEQFKHRLTFLMEAASSAYADADNLTEHDEEEFHIIAGIYEVISQELQEGQLDDMENKLAALDKRIQKFISNLGKIPDAIQ